MVCDARQYLSQVCFRIKSVDFRRANQTVDGRSALTAGVRSRKEQAASAVGIEPAFSRS